MDTPIQQANNSAAEQVVIALSTLNDLTKQITELQLAFERHQNIVSALMPLAIWKDSAEVEGAPE